MAILNTWSKCLESPYLIVDNSARTEVGAKLAFAEDRIATVLDARSQADGDAKKKKGAEVDHLMMVYQAVFACLRALLYAEGYRERGLGCLLIAIKHLYVRPGRLNARYLELFPRLQGLREPLPEALTIAQQLHVDCEALLGPIILPDNTSESAAGVRESIQSVPR